jgi:signal transduction histidine kinase
VEDRQLAEEASRMKTRFLSTISHELRGLSRAVAQLRLRCAKAQALGSFPVQPGLGKLGQRFVGVVLLLERLRQ